jgi:hypothetical protein
MLRLKGISKGGVTIGLILGCWAVPVHAEDRVVLLEDSRAARGSGLGSALRIQLTGAAEVEVRDLPENAGVSRRMQTASELTQAEDVLLVVWAEPAVELADGSREAVLYAVGHKQGRALVEIVRVRGGEGPDVERSLALKVREVVDEVRHNREQAAPSDLMLEPAAAAADVTAEQPAWGARVSLAGALAPLSGSDLGQWGARLAGGPAWRDGVLRISGLLELAVFPELEVEVPSAEVRLFELAPGALAHAQWRQADVWIGLRAGLSLSFLAAQGHNAASSGEVSGLVAPSWTFGVDVELPIGRGVGVAAALDLQARIRRQRFTVAGDQVVDLGRLRPLVSIALTWSGDGVR